MNFIAVGHNILVLKVALRLCLRAVDFLMMKGGELSDVCILKN